MKPRIKDKFHCYGCSLCEAICIHNAIVMEKDNEGFYKPSIDSTKCVQCGACVTVCNKQIEYNTLQVDHCFAFQAYDSDILHYSTSGGIIPTIAHHVIKCGGVYIATDYQPSEGAYWCVVENAKDISKFSGSKYFQIPLTSALLKTISRICKGKKLLFVGTPCQVAAVQKYVPSSAKHNLLTVDLVCGGTQSHHLEKSYIHQLENEHHSKVLTHRFRSKEYGWSETYLSVIEFSDGSKLSKLGSADLFMRTFASGCYLRESCYSCEYVGRNRISDITVGDCWGIEKLQYVRLDHKQGVSLVVCNSEKGMSALKELETFGKWEKVNESVIIRNKPLNVRTKRPFARNYSYGLLRMCSFPCAVNTVCFKYWIKKLMG